MASITTADLRKLGIKVPTDAPATPGTMTVTLPYPPSLNHLYATFRGRRIVSREGKAFKARASAIAAASGMRPIVGPVAVEIDVYRPRRSGDLDNRVKATLDCLKGIAWGDDEQVAVIHARRHEDKHNPRAVVTVTPIGG